MAAPQENQDNAVTRRLALITERIESEGVPPSQTEIATAFGFSSVRAAQYHLEALERAGAIQRVPGQARGIRLTQAAIKSTPPKPAANDDMLRLPVLGRVAAQATRRLNLKLDWQGGEFEVQ